jgi:hypothetical protein
MNSMWPVLVLILLLQGCATSSIPLHRDPYKAAVVDAATTAAVLAKGGTELNPVGFPATNLGKAAYLLYLRPRLSEKEKQIFDRWASTVWWAASVNNLLQFVVPSNVYVSATLGLATGIYLYNLEDPKPEEANHAP